MVGMDDADAPTEDDDGSGLLLLNSAAHPDTLRGWLNRSPHPWSEVLDVLVPLGRRIAAAHRAGVVHGVRPENLAVEGLDGPGTDMDTEGDGDVPSSTTDVDPGTSELLSTPAYMSPEQFRGERAGAGADQFSFCVATYEALWGQRPFAGETLPALSAAVMSGDRREPPEHPRVPAPVRDAVLRGLARDPALRFPSMPDLLAAMQPPAPRRSRRVPWVLAGAATVAAAALAGAWITSDSPRCRVDPDPMRGVWDEPARTRVHEALLSTGLPFAETTWDVVERDLDRYATSWESARHQTCTAAPDLPTPDPATQCVQWRRARLKVVVDALRTIERGAVEHVPDLVASLPAVDECLEPNPSVVEGTAEVQQAYRRLAVVETTRRLHRPSTAVEVGRSLLAEAQRLGDDRLVARVDLELGRALFDEGSYAGAVERFDHAIWIAESTGDSETAVRAGARMGPALSRQGRGADALRQVIRSRRLAERAGLSGRLKLELAVAEAEVRRDARDFEAVRDLLSVALDSGHDSPRHDPMGTSAVVLELGAALAELGEVEQGRHQALRGLQMAQTRLGPHHPRVAGALTQLAEIELLADGATEALQYHRAALEILESSVPPGDERIAKAHAGVASAALLLGNIDESDAHSARAIEILEARGSLGAPIVRPLLIRAQTLRAMGRFDAAERSVRRSLEALDGLPRGQGDAEAKADAMLVLSTVAVQQRRPDDAIRAAEEHVAQSAAYAGETSEEAGRAHLNLGTVLGIAGRYERAREELEVALPLLETTLGPSHSLVATTVNNLSACYRELGDDHMALTMAKRTVALLEERDDIPHDTVGKAYFNLGAAHSRLGQTADARVQYEAAIGHLTESEAPVATDLARAQYALGRALHSSDRKRALVLLRHARAHFETLESPDGPATVRAIDRLLR